MRPAARRARAVLRHRRDGRRIPREFRTARQIWLERLAFLALFYMAAAEYQRRKYDAFGGKRWSKTH